MDFTQSQLKELLTYKDGVLIRNTTKKQACPNSYAKGYKTITIKNKMYSEHRIIFLLHHGYLPAVIDHIDGNKLNNKIENLREATKAENLQNAKLSARNTSGIKGVWWSKQVNRWIAQLQANNETFYIGTFKDLEEAKQAVNNKRNELHKTFARNS